MDIEDLRMFAETVRRGSLSQAAASLGMTQPTVSRRLRRMESEVGAALLERTRPAVTPTRLGLRLLALADTTLREWEAIRAAARAEGERLRCTLAVGASTTPGEFLAPSLVAAFGRAEPQIQVHLQIMNSASVEACVDTHHCDVGFIGRRPRVARLKALVVDSDEVVLVLPPGHRLAGRGEVDLADLAGEPLVVREPGSGTRDAVEAALAERGRDLTVRRAVAEMGSGRALAAAVASGQGMGFVSSHLAGPDAVRLRGVPIRRPIYLIYHPRQLGDAARRFVAFVTNRCEAMSS